MNSGQSSIQSVTDAPWKRVPTSVKRLLCFLLSSTGVMDMIRGENCGRSGRTKGWAKGLKTLL